MKKLSWPVLLLFFALVEGIGALSGALSGDTGAIYQSLALPPLSPPGWLFGIVWPVLYGLMAIAAYLIYRSGDACAPRTLFWFFVQLALNFFWPLIFFRGGLYWAAALVILLLDCLVLYTISQFRSISPLAARLMIPYLLWLLFATYLNVGVALLN